MTGNIGSGKSTVAAMLRDAGIPVLDADRISREVTAPGERAYDAVVRAFGKEIVRDDGSIDRKRLGKSFSPILDCDHGWSRSPTPPFSKR